MFAHRIFFISALVMWSGLVFAEPPQNAEALVCRTGPGVSTEWKDEIPTTNPSKNEITFTFSELNQSTGSARLSGPGGSVSVKMVVTTAGVTFIEYLGSGGVVFTTVYARTDTAARTYLAADTRHNFILGSPIISQFYGVCTGQF